MQRTVAQFDERPSLDDLRSQQRTKEFQIKKLVEISHFVNDITPEMIQLAQVVASAQRGVQIAQDELRNAKNRLAIELR